jgi:signal transduction histidine kinase
VLTERGLDAAVVALAQRAPVPVDLVVDVPKRLDVGIEAAAHFVSEALTNVAKYAQAETVSVQVESTAGSLHVMVALPQRPLIGATARLRRFRGSMLWR